MCRWISLVVAVFTVACMLCGCELIVVTEEQTEHETTATRLSTTLPDDAQTAASSTTQNSTVGTTGTSATLPRGDGPTVQQLTPISPASYYGLAQLAKMSQGKKYTETYTKIAAASESFQPEIALDGSLTKDEVFMVFCYYRADYPQHFWCSGQIEYSLRNSKVIQLSLTFTMPRENIPAAKTLFERKVAEVLQVAATGTTAYDRERLIHDELSRRITYQSSTYAHDAYGALVQGKAVCEGYARAFQYVLYQAGIPCLMVEGSSVNPQTGISELHAWNIVNIDGQYYHVDLTWNDIDQEDPYVMYAYFNVTTADISRDHTISTEQCYAPPVCQATAANYHVKNNSRLTDYSSQRIADLLRLNGGMVHLYCVNGSDSFVTWFEQSHREIGAILRLNGYTYRMIYISNEVYLYMK